MRHPGSRARLDPRKNLVGFLVGQVHYAVDIWRVREIVQPLPLTPLPYTHASVVGVADHRGDVLPVVDLRLQLGAPPQSTRKTKWVLLSLGGRTVGIVVDAVTGVFGSADDRLRAAPELGGGGERRGIAGVTTHQDEMVFVIDCSMISDIIGPEIERVLDSIHPPRALDEGT